MKVFTNVSISNRSFACGENRNRWTTFIRSVDWKSSSFFFSCLMTYHYQVRRTTVPKWTSQSWLVKIVLTNVISAKCICKPYKVFASLSFQESNLWICYLVLLDAYQRRVCFFSTGLTAPPNRRSTTPSRTSTESSQLVRWDCLFSDCLKAGGEITFYPPTPPTRNQNIFLLNFSK